MAVKTSELSDHKYNAEALDDLALPEEHKSLLKSLLTSRKLFRDQDDLKIQKDSLVVLLYGERGSGKTFTTGM